MEHWLALVHAATELLNLAAATVVLLTVALRRRTRRRSRGRSRGAP
jgi:hypothetical protein